MATKEKIDEGDNESAPLTWDEFLASMPPGTLREGVAKMFESGPGLTGKLRTPEINLHCDSPKCGGERIFIGAIEGGEVLVPWRTGGENCFLNYMCRHCLITRKTFAVFAVEKVSHLYL